MKKNFAYLFLFIEFGLIALIFYYYPQVFKLTAWTQTKEKNLPLNFPIEIFFNQPVKIEQITANLVIKPNIPYETLWSEQGRRLTIKPQSLLAPNTLYQIIVPEAKSYVGTDLTNIVFNFQTETQNKTISNLLPLASTTAKKIDINLKKQVMTLIQDNQVLKEYKISSGKRKTPTKIGQFEILTKLPVAYGCGDGQCWKMPYWLGFYNAGSTENGIHELPLIKIGKGWFREGQNSLGWAVSHGCVRLGIGEAEKVYNWAATGTPVLVHY